MSAKIGIFPASGALGSSIVNHLAKLVPASDLVLSAQRPEKLHDLKQAGATVHKADYDDPSTLVTALGGMDVLMLISYASFEIDHRVKAHRLAIDAAIKSGVKYIFYSSLGFGGNLTDQTIAHVMGAHIATEKYLSSLQDKLSYTIVREGLYTESFPIYTAFFDPQNPVDEVTIPHSGTGPGVACIKRDELGEASANLIASYVNDPTSFEYSNTAVLLSGSQEISLVESVEIIGRAIGKPLKIREISIDEHVKLPQIGDQHTYKGVNPSRDWATAWDAIRQGEAAIVTPALREVLGREPESYETTVKALFG
ncbi:NmrA-like family protein [Penicillium digitatum PHI26]|uniref:NmrA-like family protein n=2 Tax=Penicillium digitatum TaxID=36651 RepID=K9FI71_PEND2|nr:NmrA-like family protein [Penicillium digitatum Pd1]EKV06749.1 NmrA-like family protein [Penicillium digitatum Pd1]EKV08919.1 NmrA-like family protein [Penicillium digitatum PHI26]